MAHLKSFRLPSFTISVRELTADERAANRDMSRDYMAVMIRHKSNDLIVAVVGSPQMGSWNEDKAARSAISFASEESCWNDPKENLWVRLYGEDLTMEAFNHGVLGKELRQ